MWGPQIEALSEEYRVIVPDLPGHGERADEPFTVERAVEVLEAILAGEESVVVVGLSLGGYVGIGLADRRPDTIEGLVLSGASIDYRGIAGATS
jgi:pimeloyl-ACP methyl ester carboxylesterase